MATAIAELVELVAASSFDQKPARGSGIRLVRVVAVACRVDGRKAEKAVADMDCGVCKNVRCDPGRHSCSTLDEVEIQAAAQSNHSSQKAWNSSAALQGHRSQATFVDGNQASGNVVRNWVVCDVRTQTAVCLGIHRDQLR